MPADRAHESPVMEPPLVADDDHAGHSDGAAPSAEAPDKDILLDHKHLLALEKAYQDKLHKQIEMGGVEDVAYGVVMRAPAKPGDEPRMVDQSKLTEQQRTRFMALPREKYDALVHGHEALAERHGKRVPIDDLERIKRLEELAAGPYNLLQLMSYVADKWEDTDALGYSGGGGVVKPFASEKAEMLYVELDRKKRELVYLLPGEPVLMDTVEHRERRAMLQDPSLEEDPEVEAIRDAFRELKSPEVRAALRAADDAVLAAEEGKDLAINAMKKTGWRWRKERDAVLNALKNLEQYKLACSRVSGPMPTKPKKPAGTQPQMPPNFACLPAEAKRKWKQEAKVWQVSVRFYNKDVKTYNAKVAEREKEIEAAEKIARKAIKSVLAKFPNCGGYEKFLAEVRALRPWNQPLSAEELARKEEKRKREAKAAEEELQNKRAARLDWAYNNAWANKRWHAAEARYDAIESKDGDGYENEELPNPDTLALPPLLHPTLFARSEADAAARTEQQHVAEPDNPDEPDEPDEPAEMALDARLKTYVDECRAIRKKKLIKKAKLAFEGKPGKLTTLARLKKSKQDIADAARRLKDLRKGSFLYRIESSELKANMWTLERNLFTLKRTATAKPDESDEPDAPDEDAPENVAKKAKKADNGGTKIVDLFKLFYATPRAPSSAAQATADADAVFEEGGEGEGATDVAMPPSRECARA
jgi:hypothetical protein